MSVQSDLRQQRGEVDGWVCRWGRCGHPLDQYRNPLELAHLEGRKMGGRKSANTVDNTVMLCRFHHRILDGDLSADRKFETRLLLAAYVTATSENH